MYPKFKNKPACEGTETDMWFTDTSSYLQEELLFRICQSCPARDECLQYALEYKVMGYWAGTSEVIRKHLRKRLNIHGKSVIPEWELKRA